MTAVSISWITRGLSIELSGNSIEAWFRFLLVTIQHALEISEKIIELVCAWSCAEDIVVSGVEEVLIIQFADETARLATGFLTPLDACGAVSHRELILRTRDADI